MKIFSMNQYIKVMDVKIEDVPNWVRNADGRKVESGYISDTGLRSDERFEIELDYCPYERKQMLERKHNDPFKPRWSDYPEPTISFSCGDWLSSVNLRTSPYLFG